MKNILKTIGVVILLVSVYIAFQGIFSVLPALIYVIKGCMDGTIAIDDVSSLSDMLGVGAGAGGALEVDAINLLAWGMFLATLAMLLFLHVTGYYKFQRGLLTSVSRRPLLYSVLLVFASMFALNILVQSFELENLLEEQLTALSHNVVGALTISVFAPLLEEVLFRGAIQGYMMRKFKPWTAIICSALVFGLIHMNPVQIVYATLLGIIFGWIYYRTGSLLPVILGHILNNSFATIVTLSGVEEESITSADTTEKFIMGLVFIVATFAALKLVRMLNKELPPVDKCTDEAVCEEQQN